MKLRYFICVVLILFTKDIFSQNTIKGYEYWFDNKVDLTTRIAVAPVATLFLDTSFTISTLSDGIHSLHIRFKDDSIKYSQAVSQFFYKYTALVLNNYPVNAYKYWFDQHEAAGVFQNVNNSNVLLLDDALVIGALPEGIHTFSIRFRDNQGKWSSAVSQFFYKYTAPTSGASSQITAYQYWYDNNFSASPAISIAATPLMHWYDSLDRSSLKDGLHTFSVRFKNNTGHWSSSISHFFSISKTQTDISNRVTAYRYWFGDMDTSLNLTDLVPFINPYLMDTHIPLDGVDSGRHVVHFQFKDEKGMWSMVTTDSLSTVSHRPTTPCRR